MGKEVNVRIDGDALMAKIRSHLGGTVDAGDLAERLWDAHQCFQVSDVFGSLKPESQTYHSDGTIESHGKDFNGEIGVGDLDFEYSGELANEAEDIEDAVESITEGVQALEELDVFNLYRLDLPFLNPAIIIADANWCIESLLQLDSEMLKLEDVDSKDYWDEEGNPTKSAKEKLKAVKTALKQVRKHKRETKEKIDRVGKHVNQLGKMMHLKPAKSIYRNDESYYELHIQNSKDILIEEGDKRTVFEELVDPESRHTRQQGGCLLTTILSFLAGLAGAFVIGWVF